MAHTALKKNGKKLPAKVKKVSVVPSVFLVIGTAKGEGSSMEQIRGNVHGAFRTDTAAHVAAAALLKAGASDLPHMLILKVPLNTVVNDGDVIATLQR